MKLTILNKILNKNIYYNLLSLLNIIVAFLFTVLLGRKFGLGSETDLYFSSIIIIGFLGSIVKGLWEAFSPDYTKIKLVDKGKSDEMYSVILNDIILVSLVIILFYSLLSPFLSFIEESTLIYLNVFIFYLLVHNILYYNKILLNLEHYYASFYIVDLFVYIVSSLFVLSVDNLSMENVAYIIIVTTLMSVIYQFFIIFYKLKFKYSFKFYNTEMLHIYVNSLKYKTGTLIYSIKDLLIVSFFTSLGTGFYSYYSYANKFAMTIAQIVNAPIVNIFTTKLNYIVAEQEYRKITALINSVLIQTIPLFIVSAILVYFLLPFILMSFFDEVLNIKSISEIQFMFLLLIIFNLIIVIETPFARSVFVFKLFNFSIIVNIVFITIFFIGFLSVKYFEVSYIFMLLSLSLAQFFNFLLYFRKYHSYNNQRISVEKNINC